MLTIKNIIIGVIMTSTFNLFAQDPTYKGPSKMDVTSFWRQAEIVKNGKATSSTLSNLEKSIANIKQKDPAYNTSSMDEIIKTCKEKVSKDKEAEIGKKEQHLTNMDASRGETQNKLKLKKMYADVFEIGAFSFGDLDKAQTENDAYKKIADDLYAMKEERAAYVTEAKNAKECERLVIITNRKYDQYFEDFIENVDKFMAESTSTDEGGNWKNVYYEMQAEQIHWDAAQKIFPNEPKFTEAYKKITAKVNQYGSLEKIAGKNKENNIESIKNTKLPVAVIKDAVLEKMFVDAFNKTYSAEYKGTATKAILLHSDWEIDRHAVSGVIIDRKRVGAIVYKGTDGKCYLISLMYLYQDYIDSSFQNTKAGFAQSGHEMLCENVK